MPSSRFKKSHFLACFLLCLPILVGIVDLKTINIGGKLTWLALGIIFSMITMQSDPRFGILDTFVSDFQLGNVEAMVSDAQEFKKIEEKKVKEWKKKYETFPRIGYTYPTYYLLAYERGEQYDEALKWAVKRQDISSFQPGGFYAVGGICEPEYTFAAIPRIYFKLGDREQAFKAFVSVYHRELEAEVWNKTIPRVQRRKEWSSQIPENKAELLRKRWRQSLTLEDESDAPIDSQLFSCFDYDGFLAFMNEEYEKLGNPKEYEEAMRFFRVLETQESFDAYYESFLARYDE